MKVRSRFVSNSSSSSFIVAFPQEPKSADEVCELLFGDEEYQSYYHEKYSTKKMAEQVFSDMQDKDAVLSREDLLEHASSIGYNRIDWRKYDTSNNKAWEAISKEAIEIGRKVLRGFLKENQGCIIYQFEYGDNEGIFFAAMEHSGIFDRLKHISINNH